MAFAANTWVRLGLTINVVRIIPELYSDVTAITPSVTSRISRGSSPVILDRTGSPPNPDSPQSLMVMPITSDTSAEVPMESTIASPTMIQVERTDRIFVHSDLKVVRKPGSAIEEIPATCGVVAVICCVLSPVRQVSVAAGEGLSFARCER
jgi:hypothetical protein